MQTTYVVYKHDTKLPYGNLKWDDELNETNKIKYMNRNTDYILEVDLEYPKELLDLCNNCPLAPEVMNLGIILVVYK